MKKNILKIFLIIIGIIPFIFVLSQSFISALSSSDFFLNLIVYFTLFIFARPWLLLSIIPFIIGVIMPSNKQKTKDTELNKKNNNIKWIVLLIIGIVPFILILMKGIYDSIKGFKGVCILDCEYSYGIKALLDSILMNSFIYGGILILGVVLIIISIIKLKTKK